MNVSEKVRSLNYRDLRHYHESMATRYSLDIHIVRSIHLDMDDLSDIEKLESTLHNVSMRNLILERK